MHGLSPTLSVASTLGELVIAIEGVDGAMCGGVAVCVCGGVGGY